MESEIYITLLDVHTHCRMAQAVVQGTSDGSEKKSYGKSVGSRAAINSRWQLALWEDKQASLHKKNACSI